MKKHPTDLYLEGLYLDLGQESWDVLVHLTGCPRCQARLADLQRRRKGAPREPHGQPEDPGLDGETPEARVLIFSLVLLGEWIEAPELFVDLLRQPAAKREAWLRADARFHTWGFCELLIERSLETATRDPEHAVELGRLGLALSVHLNAPFYGPESLEDLRARAWAHIANARRVRSDLAGADQGFAAARVHLLKGAQDPLQIGVILDLEASLRRGQRRLDEAAGLFRQAAGIFLRHGDPHRAGRSLVKLSTVHYFQGEMEAALADLRRSLDLLDAEREPRLRLCAQHNLAFYLTEAGRFEEARAVYREARPLYRDFPEPWVQNRRKWVRARILRGLGHLAPAESLFLAARDGFLAEGVPYDTALISLEIATLYAEQERTAELKRLAREMVPIFSSLHIHREALAALGFFVQAIESETASLEIVTAVAEYLHRAEREPELPFRLPKPSRE